MNHVILVGRLSRDPDVRYTPSQMAVARFTVAVDRAPSRNGNQQDNQPTADFIDVTAFGKTAEIIERFFMKGKWIGVQGRIQNNNYTNKDGVTVYTYQVIADRIEFVGNKGEDGGSSRSGGYSAPQRGGNYSAPQRDGNGGGGFSGGAQDSDIPEGFSALEDEDIPF